MSLKEKLMNQMMDKHFEKMSSEEKQKIMSDMMDKFFSGMTDIEKKDMMSEMMPKMMEKMVGGNSSGNPMMGMMQMMMGKGNIEDGDSDKMPWDNCMEMMSGFRETAYSAKFATPELRGLFEEWCSQIEQEIMEYINNEKKVNPKSISEKLNLTVESVMYLLNQLAQKNMLEFKMNET